MFDSARLALIVAGVGAQLLLASCGGGGTGTAELPARDALIARAKALELNTPYVPPPGDPLEHATSGYAKAMCSAVFITHLDPDVAAESVGYFTGPYEQRKLVGTPVVDRVKQEVRITMPNGPTLVARYYGSQGCITLPAGADDVYFKTVTVTSALPDPAKLPWSMGDVLSTAPASGYYPEFVAQVVAAAFGVPQACTAAFVVTHKGRIIGERYMDGITIATPLESWSMGESVTATMMGVLIGQGVYQLDQPAPIPEWQTQGDPRSGGPTSWHAVEIPIDRPMRVADDRVHERQERAPDARSRRLQRGAVYDAQAEGLRLRGAPAATDAQRGQRVAGEDGREVLGDVRGGCSSIAPEKLVRAMLLQVNRDRLIGSIRTGLRECTEVRVV